MDQDKDIKYFVLETPSGDMYIPQKDAVNLCKAIEKWLQRLNEATN